MAVPQKPRQPMEYSVGTPVTYDEMMRIRSGGDTSVNMDGTADELLFDDDPPVGAQRYALLSMAGPRLRQKHQTGSFLKVRCVTATRRTAERIGGELAKKTNSYDILLVELYKFLCLPPPPPDMTSERMDSEMVAAIQGAMADLENSKARFQERKTAMLDDMRRQNQIAQRIADNELDPSEMESNCLYPEEMTKGENEQGEEGDLDECDAYLGNDKFVVIATIEVNIFDDRGVIFKICGAFETEEGANALASGLKKQTRYKPYDIVVAQLGAWLSMPPPADVIDNVVYDCDKLTEVLGTRKTVINVKDTRLQEPADDPSIAMNA